MDSDVPSNSITQLVVPDLKIKGAAARAYDEAHKNKDTAVEGCTICLESITERAVAVPCNHLTFDFICLVSWLQERATCPLCNAAVTEVQYDWASSEDFKTYLVPKLEPSRDSSRGLRAGGRSGGGSRRHVSRFIGERAEQASTAREDPALEQRRHVYRHRLFSLHIGANPISQHRDFTHETFAASPELQSRARAFLRRELQVFSFLDMASAPRGGNRTFLVEYIVAILKTNELKGANGHAEDLLAEFLGRNNTTLILHELEAWLRSPHARVEEWDREVQYVELGQVAKPAESG